MTGGFAACPDCDAVFEAVTEFDAQMEVDLHLSETDCERRVNQ